MFHIIVLSVLSLATFFFTSQIGMLLAEAINYGTSAEVWMFGGIWLGLLGISITLGIAAVREVIYYNDHRPRKPLRNK